MVWLVGRLGIRVVLVPSVEDRVDVMDGFWSFLIWPRESIRDEIGLALDVADVSCVFAYTRQLVGLSRGLRISLFGHRGHQTLMVGI